MNADLKHACFSPATAQSVKNPTQDFGAAKRTPWWSSFRHIPIHRVNFTCAKMCLPSGRFLVKSPEKWHKCVTSCHENAAGQPLCRLRRRQQPQGCKFLYLHILWRCGHQRVHSTWLADTTDIKTLGTGQGNQKWGPDSALSLLMLLGSFWDQYLCQIFVFVSKLDCYKSCDDPWNDLLHSCKFLGLLLP